MKPTQTIITSNISIGNGAFLMSFPREFTFIAGQSVGITTNLDLPFRLYSLASGIHEAHASILYKVMNEGQLTPQMSLLKPGDTIYVSAPSGLFTMPKAEAIWVASGTGIAPFISMLKSGAPAPLLLLQGSSTTEGLWFADFFKDRLGNKYLPCVTKQLAAHYFHGRVTEKLEQLDFDIDTTTFYLCGRAEMVVDARDILINRGVAFNRIISEIYF